MVEEFDNSNKPSEVPESEIGESKIPISDELFGGSSVQDPIGNDAIVKVIKSGPQNETRKYTVITNGIRRETFVVSGPL